MQAIPENSNKQTNVCLTGTLCTTAAFNDPPKSRKPTVFAFAPVTNAQEERLRIPGDCDSGSKFSSRYAAPFPAQIISMGRISTNVSKTAVSPSFASIFHRSHK